MLKNKTNFRINAMVQLLSRTLTPENCLFSPANTIPETKSSIML